MVEQEVKQIDETTEPVSTEVPYDKTKSSGLGRMIQRMSVQPEVKVVDPMKPAEPEKPAEPVKPEDKKFDYGLFKDLSEKDIKELQENWKDVSEERRFQYINAINDIKKNQRLVSERQLELDNVKKSSNTEKYTQFLDELKKDFIGTYDKYKDEFNLPDLEVVKKQVTTGGFQARLAQWQENDLTPQIEKKHKLEEGTFVYEPEEAYKAGTPSYDYRVMTMQKERDFIEEDSRVSKVAKDAMGKIEEARKEQLLELKQTYFPDLAGDSEEVKARNAENEQKFISMLSKIDEMGKGLAEGKFDANTNPFALKNIFRGVHFDELVKQAVDAEANKIHQEYHKLGFYLPNNGKDMPSDLTKINGRPEISQTDEAKLKRSPMARMISRTIK